MGYQRRLSEASGRIVALLEKVPALEDGPKPESDQGDVEIWFTELKFDRMKWAEDGEFGIVTDR